MLPPDTRLHLRSYGQDGHAHQHDHLQIVLPVRGAMEIEVGGRGARLDHRQAALIVPQARHDQHARAPNCFLVLDCPTESLPARQLDAWQRQPFMPMPAHLHLLVEYLSRQAADAAAPGMVGPPIAPLGAALLLQALQADPAQGFMPASASAQRMLRVQQQVRSQLDHPWTVAEMACIAHWSASRLQAIFPQHTGLTPQQWLQRERLQLACRLLVHTPQSIAAIAQHCGYAGQSALTRAMRRNGYATPARYRREGQDKQGSSLP
ncbi:AraC family transcriptional regulator [Corticibacter populi]|uniref:AraC family transcriptional regulator n=1 Tax=Corticibacter populi TaxID=1550736 RepID=A0A3M6QGJ5_9BURK|nr:AraC family transcriptional regulator [Corticibacter populi]RMX02220.1 AraC family transcriptional regulator [Corticibacter populi]RZS29512.1 AraC family transcriptional regulator [Corticibacter populi]